MHGRVCTFFLEKFIVDEYAAVLLMIAFVKIVCCKSTFNLLYYTFSVYIYLYIYALFCMRCFLQRKKFSPWTSVECRSRLDTHSRIYSLYWKGKTSVPAHVLNSYMAIDAVYNIKILHYVQLHVVDVVSIIVNV